MPAKVVPLASNVRRLMSMIVRPQGREVVRVSDGLSILRVTKSRKFLGRGWAMPKGVKIEDLRVGDGALAGRRTTVTLRYDGFLRRGDRFQSTTCTFDMSGRDVIAGLRYEVEGMRVGGLRQLTISLHLGTAQQ